MYAEENMPIKEGKVCKVERNGRDVTDRWRKWDGACQRAGEKTESGWGKIERWAWNESSCKGNWGGNENGLNGDTRGETKGKGWAMVIEKMRARPRLMRAAKRGGKRLSCLFWCRDSRMNYSRGTEQENINLTLFLNSDLRSSPSFSPKLPSRVLAFRQAQAEGIVENPLVMFILIFKYKLLQKTKKLCGFLKTLCSWKATVKMSSKDVLAGSGFEAFNQNRKWLQNQQNPSFWSKCFGDSVHLPHFYIMHLAEGISLIMSGPQREALLYVQSRCPWLYGFHRPADEAKQDRGGSVQLRKIKIDVHHFFLWASPLAHHSGFNPKCKRYPLWNQTKPIVSLT